MKFPLSWLKRYLATDASLEALAEAMTMAGLEVEQIHDPARELAAMSVARIRSVARHPDADRLSVCEVETADGIKSIVCGAPNVAPDMSVIYAPLGCYIPGLGQALDKTPRQIRGVESQGMMCSARELGIGEEHDGIIALEGAPAVGILAAVALGLDDPVIEIEVTPNRPDLLGVSGIARDLGACGIGTFRDSDFEPVTEAFPCPIEIHIEALKACPVFAARLIRGVSNGPSPDWLQQALAATGTASRNRLVDVTNFLSTDRARPLHVFDADKLAGALHIGMGEEGQSLEALDGNTYSPGPQVCVISDRKGPVSIGGIIGGAASAVSEQTKTVLLECAWFDPAMTARAGRSLNLDSEARRRFERGVDPGSVPEGLDRATRLILDLAGGEASAMQIAGTAPLSSSAIAFAPSEVARLAGFSPSLQACRTILDKLGCEVSADTDKDAGKIWQVTPPGFRPDLKAPADLVEEIVRIAGYNQLPESQLPPCPAPPPDPRQIQLATARRLMAARGFSECLSWSFMDRKIAENYHTGPLSEQTLIDNPIACDLNTMRPSLLAALAAAIARNMAKGVRDIRLFEAGSLWQAENSGKPLQQRPALAALVCPEPSRHWAGAAPLYDAIAAKGDLLALLAGLGWPQSRFRLGTAPAHWHPGQSASLFLGKIRVADFGQLHPRRVAEQHLETALFGFELYLDTLSQKRAGTTRNALQKSDQTPIIRDFAFETDEQTPAGELARLAATADRQFIESARVFDVYRGGALAAERKSIAIEVIIRPRGRPLSETEISAVCDRIVQKVTQSAGTILRQ